METHTSFDFKNSKWYLIAIAAMLLGELAVIVSVLMGNSPAFGIDNTAAVSIYGAAALFSILCMLAIAKPWARPIYWLCFALIAFSLAGIASGYNSTLCILAGAGAIVVLVASLVLGDKGDTNSPHE